MCVCVCVCVCVWKKQLCWKSTLRSDNCDKQFKIAIFTRGVSHTTFILNCFIDYTARSCAESWRVSCSGSHRANCDICISFYSYETWNVGDLDSAAWFCNACFFHTMFCNVETDPFSTFLGQITRKPYIASEFSF